MKMPSMRLLVVGGRGFIGRYVVDSATKLGWQVTTLGISSGGRPRIAPDGVKSLVADITDRVTLQEALGDTEFDYVVNCGGYIDHSLLRDGGQRVIDEHFIGLVNLVAVVDRRRLRAFVNIGSSDEYGNIAAPQRESQREAPFSPYSCGKLAATHFLQMLHRSEDYPATILRLFLTYGPGQDDRRFLPQIIRACLAGKEFPVSDGRQLRDFCFIQDIVNAIMSALACDPARGEVINIGSGVPISIRDMVSAVRDIVGRGTPLYGRIAYRRGENMELYADISKANSILKWQPQTTLSIGLRRTVEEMQRAQ